MLKICVGIPSGRFWEAEFGQSLGLLSAAFMAHDPGRETSFHIVNVRSSLLPVGRSRIVHEALANGATHILWLDSDMMVPPDTLTRLLAHDLPVVACNYVRKEIPASPTARALDGRRLATLAGSTGLERVRHAGMGVMLTRTDIFRDLPEPWFPVTWHKARADYVGEDVYFCHLLASRGIDIVIDHDLSKRVAHIGSFEYRNELSDLETPRDCGEGM